MATAAATLLQKADTVARLGSSPAAFAPLPKQDLLAAMQAMSIGSVSREICTAGTVAVVLDDDGQCVNVGREQRLFTARQRIGLGVRDGGCMWPGCDRPPSWCEAHHINPWHRDRGRTDIADGVLLCKHHHLLLHNNGWEIVRQGGKYTLIPPRSIDPTRQGRHLTTKSRAVQDWTARRRRSRLRNVTPLPYPVLSSMGSGEVSALIARMLR